MKELPEAALGAILIFVASRLFHLPELRRIMHFGWFEFALALVTLATVAVVGIEQGVVAAALIALAYRAKLTARPRGAVLGREPGTSHWIETDVGGPPNSCRASLSTSSTPLCSTAMPTSLSSGCAGH